MLDRNAAILFSTGLTTPVGQLQDGRECASAEIVTTLIKADAT